jgi:putative lipoprotein
MNIYLEHRRLHLLGGVVMLLAFWLVVSFPTNTHTFFYRSTVTDVAQQDLSTTKSYLQQLRDNVKSEQDIRNKQDQLDREVETLLVALNNEIDNIANPGFGPRSKEILSKIAVALQIEEIPALSYTTSSVKSIQGLKDQYRKMILEQLKVRKSKLRENYTNQQEKHFKPEAIQAIKNIEVMQAEIARMGAEGSIDNDLIKQADIALKQGYATIHNYRDHINFTNESDKVLYEANDQVTRTARLLSVFDVWKDYVSGKYAGRGFIFWILLSLVVDIAAFIFFDIAFARRED